ncbi:hypothetical protein E2562_018461 [Oryza meyeriana var. granulata]|uniref:Bromo domain-containing protein n=1 Tax=Oryza meyeriana var. granulata TaxID=110450 RepID=A0A6G1EMH4_9ORYZ|nr:hypothetical protein E2562_018461 [Oryza meyeriana var. granulata]
MASNPTLRRRLDVSAAGSGGGAAGRYYPAAEFCRDLLLLCANAVVFFPRVGPEHGAAAEARALVFVSLRLREPKQEPGAAAAVAAGHPLPEDMQRVEGGAGSGGADIVGSLIEKGGKLLIVCRKRSSIAREAARRWTVPRQGWWSGWRGLQVWAVVGTAAAMRKRRGMAVGTAKNHHI